MTGNLNACPLAPYHVLTVIHESPSYETTLTLQPIKDTQNNDHSPCSIKINKHYIAYLCLLNS